MGGILFPTEEQRRSREQAEQLNRQKRLTDSLNIVRNMIELKKQEIATYRGAALAKPEVEETFEAMIDVCKDDLVMLEALEENLRLM